MFLQSVLDAGFKKYGRVIADIDTSEIVKLMDSYDMPEDVVYVAGDLSRFYPAAHRKPAGWS